MAISAQAALLDELMGKNRNIDPSEAAQKGPEWLDEDVCKYFLCGFCPNELFTNSKADLGQCPLSHDERVRGEYQKSKDVYRLGFEEEFVKHLNSLLIDVERRIRRGHERLNLNSTMTNPNGLGNSERKVQIDTLTTRIGEIVAQAETLGTEGNVEEAQGLLKLSDQLQQEKARLEQDIDERTGMAKELEVCEICGAFRIRDDAPQRIEEHLLGKMHLGYAKIRDYLRDHEDRKNERTIKHKNEARQRDKDRDSRRSHSRHSGSRSHRDSSRDKRDRKRSSSRDRNRRSSRDRSSNKGNLDGRSHGDYERLGSSSNNNRDKNKNGSRSSKEKDRDSNVLKERSSDLEKDKKCSKRTSSREKDIDRKSSREKDRDRKSSRDRDRERKSSRDRDRERKSSRDRDRERKPSRDRDRERKSSRDRDRERKSCRDRDSERKSSRDRDREKKSSSDRDRERKFSRDRDRERKSSRDRKRKSNSRDRVKKSSSRDQVKKSNSRDRVKKSSSRDRVKKSSSRDEVKKSSSRDREKKSSSRDRVEKSIIQDRKGKSSDGDWVEDTGGELVVESSELDVESTTCTTLENTHTKCKKQSSESSSKEILCKIESINASHEDIKHTDLVENKSVFDNAVPSDENNTQVVEQDQIQDSSVKIESDCNTVIDYNDDPIHNNKRIHCDDENGENDVPVKIPKE